MKTILYTNTLEPIAIFEASNDFCNPAHHYPLPNIYYFMPDLFPIKQHIEEEIKRYQIKVSCVKDYEKLSLALILIDEEASTIFKDAFKIASMDDAEAEYYGGFSGKKYKKQAVFRVTWLLNFIAEFKMVPQ